MSKLTKLRIGVAAVCVAPQLDLKNIYLGMMQFMVIKLICMALIFMFRKLALWSPTNINGQ